MVKAIFFDIDGTLVSFKTHKMSDSTQKALNELRAKGIKLFIASGRHILSMNNIGDWKPDGYVTLNGGMCIINNEVIYKNSIPNDDIINLIRYIETIESFPCVFVEEDKLWMNYENETTKWMYEMINFPIPPIAPLHSLNGRTVFQLLVFLEKEKEIDLMKKLPKCEATRWSPLFTDIIAAGNSKWNGIIETLKHFNIQPEETMVFGDGGNDIDMLLKAPIGVAMGNSEENVKQAADYVTDSVDNDGIEKALKHFGLIF